jgi:hypothetical protein
MKQFRKMTAVLLSLAVLFIGNIANVYAEPSVSYKGGADEFVTTSNDFFRDIDMGQMLPGDVYKGKAKISNTSSGSIRLKFRTKPDSHVKDAEGKDMLADFDLAISTESNGHKKTIYKGKTNVDSGFIDIGRYVPGKKTELLFELKVPESHTNRFNMSASAIDWTFAVEKEPSRKASPVRTWDDSHIGRDIAVLAVLAALAVMKGVKVKCTKNRN